MQNTYFLWNHPQFIDLYSIFKSKQTYQNLFLIFYKYCPSLTSSKENDLHGVFLSLRQNLYKISLSI